MLLCANEGSTLRASTTIDKDAVLIVIRITSSLSGPERARSYSEKGISILQV
jgi:hypothetical protein